MNYARLVAATLLALSTCASAGTSIAVGRFVSEDDNVRIEPIPEELCPADSICLFGWSRWTLDIDRSIVGPLVKGRIHAVHMQHTTHNRKWLRGLRLFTLEHIDDSAERLRLHADYKLLDFPESSDKICTSVSPERFDIAPGDIYTNTSGDVPMYCFLEPRHKRW